MRKSEVKNAQSGEKEVLLVHLFDAPRELVFKAWTDPEQLLKWFAPQGTSITYEEINVVTGGTYHSCIHDPVHGECWCKGTYLLVSYPDKLVYSIQMTDRAGNDLSSADAGKDPNFPAKTILTVSFKEIGGKTELTLHQTVSEEIANRTGALPSWINMLGRLDSLLVNKSLN